MSFKCLFNVHVYVKKKRSTRCGELSQSHELTRECSDAPRGTLRLYCCGGLRKSDDIVLESAAGGAQAQAQNAEQNYRVTTYYWQFRAMNVSYRSTIVQMIHVHTMLMMLVYTYVVDATRSYGEVLDLTCEVRTYVFFVYIILILMCACGIINATERNWCLFFDQVVV